jgi:hypothetical protein
VKRPLAKYARSALSGVNRLIEREAAASPVREKDSGGAKQAALAEFGAGALGEVVGLLQVRLAGQDEVVDADGPGPGEGRLDLKA